MKILVLANNDVGLYKFRKELIQRLLEDNDVVISLPYGELIKPLQKIGCIFINTFVDRRGINPVTDLGLLLKYRRLIKNEKPEMVVTYTIKPNVYGGLVCRMLKVPYAINITGLGTAFQKNGILKKIVTILYKVACKRAKVVFFENAENLQIFVDSKIIKKEKSCLLNGAGVNLSDYQVQEYPEGHKTQFLFMGRVMREKGINELFAAMQKLIAEGINCSLDVVGECEEDYKDEIQKYELQGWLTYHGYQKDIRPFIKNAHCFVLPSWHEGMANTNLECAASGRPIITSDIHGCLEAVEDGVSGYLCKKENTDSLYEAMKKFIGLQFYEREHMGLEGRKRMERMFDKNKVVERTITKLFE